MIIHAASMECDSQVIQLTDVACRNCDLVGGKGASLAFMMALKENGDVSTFHEHCRR